jgi:hypothetical protein
VESSQKVENLLIYRFGSSWISRFRGTLSSRQIQFNLLTGPLKGPKRERKDFNTSGTASISFKTNSFRGDMTLSYSGTEQVYHLSEHLSPSPYSGSPFLITPDNRNSYTILSLLTKWQWSRRDSLFFYSNLQRFKYDTPDPENFDDRDEIRYRVDVEEIHSFSQEAELHLAMSFHLLHLVYIYGEKSADNAWTRIFRFNPTFFWSPMPGLRFTQTAEVLANYVDHDYESLLAGNRSFLYRKFRLEDSTWVQTTSRTSLFLHYQMELDENGKLFWDEWTEQRLIDRQSHTLTLKLNYRSSPIFHIDPGYTFYSRRGYNYTVDPTGVIHREFNLDFRSEGPSLQISYRTNRLRIKVEGSSLRTKTLSARMQILTRISLNASWIF